jgi:stage II sporulation protein D
MRTGGRWRVGAGLALVATLALASPTPAVGATWVIRGAGFGHGVGMSAYGAYGFGKHGAGYREILRHYYVGTEVTTLSKPRMVRVLIAERQGDVRLTGAVRACGVALEPSRAYRVRAARGGVALVTGGGDRVAACRVMRARASAVISLDGIGAYRGELIVHALGGSTVRLVNRVDVDDYVRGVMPAEVPSSWPRATLRAFAVAMRSVALTTDVGGAGFELYPDTRTQVYRGAGAETPATDAAVRATRDEVVTYRGRLAQTPYFSSSGGRTESGFLGAPKVPYLRSVEDPYDHYAPQHRWVVRFSQAEIEARLAPYLRGRLRRIRVLERGDSPRIVTAEIVGTRGATTIRGDALQAALGLYDRWAFIHRRPG